MRALTQKMSYFADVVLAALVAIEDGEVDTATFTFRGRGQGKSVTVGAIWVGDVYSWRVQDGGGENVFHLDRSEELLAGNGDGGEAAAAAARLCWNMANFCETDGEWALLA